MPQIIPTVTVRVDHSELVALIAGKYAETMNVPVDNISIVSFSIVENGAVATFSVESDPNQSTPAA